MTSEELDKIFGDPRHVPYYFYDCNICFGPVSRENREKHLAWHDGLARVAKNADHAYMWTSPIGGFNE